MQRRLLRCKATNQYEQKVPKRMYNSMQTSRARIRQLLANVLSRTRVDGDRRPMLIKRKYNIAYLCACSTLAWVLINRHMDAA